MSVEVAVNNLHFKIADDCFPSGRNCAGCGAAIWEGESMLWFDWFNLGESAGTVTLHTRCVSEATAQAPLDFENETSQLIDTLDRISEI